MPADPLDSLELLNVSADRRHDPAQELAGHSTPTLTAGYSHRRLHDLAGGRRETARFPAWTGACDGKA